MTMMGYFPSSVDNDVRFDVSSIVLRFFVSSDSMIMSLGFLIPAVRIVSAPR